MINWFRKKEVTDYNNKILCGFPKGLKLDIKAVLDILPLTTHDIKLYEKQTHKVENLIHPTTLTVQLDGEPLSIPYRFYFNEPEIEEENKLSSTQRTILNRIFLRHHDGYVRQKRLEQIIGESEYWTTPYTLQLLGDYVYEILEVLDKHVNNKNLSNYNNFVKENPRHWQQTESRMISYWNAYYRTKFSGLEDYLGSQIASRIKKANA